MRIILFLVLLFAASPLSAQRIQGFARPLEPHVQLNMPTDAPFALEADLRDSAESDEDSVIEGFLIGAVGGAAVGLALDDWATDSPGANANAGRLFFLLALGLGAAIGSAVDGIM